VPAYNLGNFMRSLAMPKVAEVWSLTGLREKLIMIGAKVVSHGRYIIFQMAEIAMRRQMFREILSAVARCGRRPHQRERAPDQIRRATKVEVRLDEGKPAVTNPRGRLLITLLAAPATGGGDLG
jgi:hypothetical protein